MMNAPIQIWENGALTDEETHAALVNGDSYSSAGAVTLDTKWSMSLWVMGTATFSITDGNKKDLIENPAKASETKPLDLNGTVGKWTHVTIFYTPTSSEHGAIFYRYNDRDMNGVPDANGGTAGNNNTKILVDRSAGGSYMYGIHTTSSGSYVVMNSFSSYATTSAEVALVDTDQNMQVRDSRSSSSQFGTGATFVSTNTTTSNVYSGDNLSLTYRFSFLSKDTLSTTIDNMEFEASQIDHVTWENATVTKYSGLDGSGNPTGSSTPVKDNVSLTDITDNKDDVFGSLQPGDTIEISMNGKADDVTEPTAVAAQTYRFFNGGAESYMDADPLSKLNSSTSSFSFPSNLSQTPKFTILPALKTSSKVSVVDNDWESKDGGKTLVNGSTVLAGDSLTYDYSATYDKSSSVASWSDVLAKISTPSGFTPKTYTIKYSDGSSESSDASDVVSGHKLQHALNANNQTVHIIVEGTVNSGAKSVGTTTATLSSDSPKHAETMTTGSYTVIPEPFKVDNTKMNLFISNPKGTTASNGYQLGKNLTFDSNGNISVKAVTSDDGSYTNYNEDSNGFIINGNVTVEGSSTNNPSGLITYLITVNGDRTLKVQLPAKSLNDSAFSFKFIKPGKEQTWDGNIQSSLNAASSFTHSVVPITLGYLEPDKVNTIKIQAVMNDGSAATDAQTVYVQPGQLKLNAADIEFKTQLNGREKSIAPTSANVSITNTALLEWKLSVSQTTAITNDATGKTLAANLMYYTGSGDQYTDLSSSTDGTVDRSSVDIDTGVPANNDLNGSVNVTSKWATTDAEAGAKPGIFLDIFGNAKAGSYSGELTWTLTDAP
ncbi:hypothetical protein FC18_GL000884 [Lacticaseibacillus sharpeae JCM 1186 = DSM 20505]|uniref:WxL domain-containing protein n=2 Tax=Lacticaseibacillus sharpeae TaxID=1626 RepID=A0A0R1ZMZ3_9LACO|nr:hypothetical protein FC18_GL000884 [Lacticaseibacillus sharpeae JCM 1186 = DSM 20505]